MEARRQPTEGHREDRGRANRNVGDLERKVSLAVGAVSLAYGVRRGGPVGWAVAAAGGVLGQRGITGHCYGNDLIGRNSAKATDRGLMGQRPLHFKTGVTIARPPAELYEAWRGFAKLPMFMKYIGEIRPAGPNRTHWVARGPLGTKVEWDAEVVEEVPNERIAWRSLEGSDIHQSGEIDFRPAPGGRGTEVQLDLQYEAPVGKLTQTVGRFINTLTEEAAREDLRRFKRLMESGEVATGATHSSANEPDSRPGAA